MSKALSLTIAYPSIFMLYQCSNDGCKVSPGLGCSNAVACNEFIVHVHVNKCSHWTEHELSKLDHLSTVSTTSVDKGEQQRRTAKVAYYI